MPGELVFITGATGFVGFQVLIHALQAGYRVRLLVRRASQINAIREHQLIAPFSATPIEFFVVPDITTDGAFNDVLEDVVFVQHVVSPLPRAHTENPENDIILPAMRGTTSILNSALKVPTIRRIVVTSSAVAIIPTPALQVGNNLTLYTASDRGWTLPQSLKSGLFSNHDYCLEKEIRRCGQG